MSGLTNGVSPGPSVNVGELGRLKSELSIHPSEWRKKTSWGSTRIQFVWDGVILGPLTASFFDNSGETLP